MQDSVLQAIQAPSPLTYLLVFVTGLITSLGACAVLEAPILIGYLTGVSTKARKRLFVITLFFVLGMLTTYVLIGIFIGLIGTAVKQLTFWSTVLYLVMGVVSLTLGLIMLGFFRLPFSTTKTLSKIGGSRGDLWGAFILGLFFIFLEAPTCPACAPALMLISTYMVTQQKVVLGVALLLTYVTGQAVPILALGLFTGWMKQLTERFHRLEEYLRIVGGILLLLVGLDLLWLA